MSDGTALPAEHGLARTGSPMAVLAARLDALEAAVEAVLAVEPSEVHGPAAIDASARIQRSLDRLRGQRLGLLGQIDADGLWALDTVRTLPHWLALKERVSLAAARADVRTARLLRDELASTARSVRTGRITPEHVGIVVGVAATSEARRAALTAPVQPSDGDDTRTLDDHAPGPGTVRGEDVLLAHAEGRSLRDFVQIARRFAVVTDPESDERGYRQASEREHLDLAPTLGGYHLSGFLTEEHGQVLTTALAAVTGPREPGCPQSPSKRRAVALAGLARHALDSGRAAPDGAVAAGGASAGGASAGGASAVRPHLTVTVSWTEFTQLLGRGEEAAAQTVVVEDSTAAELSSLLAAPSATWQDGRGPVPRQVLAQIAADCELTRVVFGPDSQILDVGRAQRTFTGPRRRAVIARDRHCVWPDCTAPPQHSQIHHARRHWADGGRTATPNAALLCWFHHDHVDTHRIAMTHVGGRWLFHPRGSYPLASSAEHAEAARAQPTAAAPSGARAPTPERATPPRTRLGPRSVASRTTQDDAERRGE